jgi:2-amino-1-hydroxyethylphosphonate dioxygenase (glycine-forming)
MSTSSSSVVQILTDLYTASANLPYGSSGKDLDINPLGNSKGDSIGFLAHGLQCAFHARNLHPNDDELIAASLLHDIGWLLPKPSDKTLLTGGSGNKTETETETDDSKEADAKFIARHDLTGSDYLARLGFSPRVCKLVGGHVNAKRYLVATNEVYASVLSPGSTRTLALQGGPMTPEEVIEYEKDPLHTLYTALRRWDEGAKVPNLQVDDWSSYIPLLTRLLDQQLFKSFSEQFGPLQLTSVLQESDQFALTQSDKGYVVVRNWLSQAEIAALNHYAVNEVPNFEPSQVHHTYEQIGDDVIAPSRTEKFAHVIDSKRIGQNFLMSGRLREVCAALREGREMALYKEKVNYKLKGGSGGYLPHQDYYHGFDSETGKMLTLLPDTDVCVCMLAIDAMDTGNGCPEVAPGWHTKGPIHFQGSLKWEFSGMEPPTSVDPSQLPWTPVTLSSGDVLIYGNLMPHQSAENKSDRDRRALFAIYTDSTKHGEKIRELYYSKESKERRANGSAKDGGKANLFFTGKAILKKPNETIV